VIVPTLTFIGSVNPIVYCGATPVFVDSDPLTWQIDPHDVARKLTPRTKAIMAVHLYGLPADMAALRSLAEQAGVPLVEITRGHRVANRRPARRHHRRGGGLQPVWEQDHHHW
jgi:hypothetical protein